MKLKHGDMWLRDFGQSLTENEDAAREFSPEEGVALMELHPEYAAVVSRVSEASQLASKAKPAIRPPDGFVWVRYGGTWLAAEKQHLFLATRFVLDKTTERRIA